MISKLVQLFKLIDPLKSKMFFSITISFITLCAISKNQFCYQDQTSKPKTIFLSVMIAYHEQPTTKSRFLSIRLSHCLRQKYRSAKNENVQAL